MKTNLSLFEKKHDFLICIDSDGCAIDSMKTKHQECFAPKAIKEWDLYEIKDRFIVLWNDINLYSKTRGINRFKGLVKTMEALSKEGFKIPDFSSVRNWIEKANELSNLSLEHEIQIAEHDNTQLKKTLHWSKEVNSAVSKLSNKPFQYVMETLQKIKPISDVSVISSANRDAILEEWSDNNISSYVQLLLGQEAGDKPYCINQLKQFGYLNSNVLMIGDSPGDLKASQTNEVLFYPIIAGQEYISWKRLVDGAIDKFFNKTFEGSYQKEVIGRFLDVLKK